MFHIPERYRIVVGRQASNASYGNNGAFSIPSPLGRGRELFVIASDGAGWEHVSCDARMGNKQMTPLWDEMCYLKDVFWDGEDTVIQYHPPKSEYVNMQPNTLHLWRPTRMIIPTPPSILVGLKG